MTHLKAPRPIGHVFSPTAQNTTILSKNVAMRITISQRAQGRLQNAKANLFKRHTHVFTRRIGRTKNIDMAKIARSYWKQCTPLQSDRQFEGGLPLGKKMVSQSLCQSYQRKSKRSKLHKAFQTVSRQISNADKIQTIHLSLSFIVKTLPWTCWQPR